MPDHDALIKKIDELNTTAWDNRVSDSKKTLECAKEAIELSRAIKYPKGLGDALVLAGFAFMRISDFENATASLNEAESIYNILQNIRGLAVLNEYKGIIERYHGNNAAALKYIYKALEQSRQTMFTENEVTNLYQIGVTYRQLANYDKALEYLYSSLSLARKIKIVIMEGYNMNVIGSIYFEIADYNKALPYYKQAYAIIIQIGDKWGEAGGLDNIGFTYFKLEDYTQAAEYCKKGLAITRETNNKKGEANCLLHLAEIYGKKNDISESARFSNESLTIRRTNGDKRGEAEILLFLAELNLRYPTTKETPNVHELLINSLRLSKETNAYDIVSKTQFHLYQYYKFKKDFEKAVHHLELHIQNEKDLHKNSINQKILNLEISYKAEEAKREADAIREKNEELTKFNNEIEKQKLQLEKALNNLKSTQAQLIQSEKMASLGELTAGIAHEIQNPLNFVNNFSEVNREMIEELLSEKAKAKNERDEKLEIELLNDIKANEEKINHHGKRADAIVKGMLQHSRQTSGIKEPTDINKLCDEYLRLSYHGLRAKDKSFNADFKTDFDESIGKINVVPQDIGRVLLNLFNNAFYAVNRSPQSLKGNEYKPLVTVSTKKTTPLQGPGATVEIVVSDNGNGIPQNIIDKIFQPFFTTKPTGQGTGLGLSLSYDIIKAHGGEIKVESKEGAGSKFIIQIPILI